METNSPTFQEALGEMFLNTFSFPSWRKGSFRPKMVGTKNMVQRIELEGKDGQNSIVVVSPSSFSAHSSTFSQGVCAIRASNSDREHMKM